MKLTIKELDASPDETLAERLRDALRQQSVPSLRRVSVDLQGTALVLRGEVHSFYAKQVLDHVARRVAGDRPVVDEVFVVQPSTFRDPLRLRRSAAAGVGLLLLVAMIAGCGSGQESERVAVHPVSGQVLFNGRPAAGAFVVFHPKGTASGFPAPRAQSDRDGKFTVTTYSTGDGAPTGEYAVTVVLEPMVKKGEDFERGQNVLPQKYSNPQTTAVVARVNEGENSLPIKIVR